MEGRSSHNVNVSVLPNCADMIAFPSPEYVYGNHPKSRHNADLWAEVKAGTARCPKEVPVNTFNK